MGAVEAAAQAASSGRKERVSRSATLDEEGVSAEKEVGAKSCTHIAPWESCEESHQDLLQSPTLWLHAQHSQVSIIPIPVTS